ncbi:hypothetical protein BK702_03730 [Bacillus thuringiensis serovar cameroun]|nr:hypothetical protein BK702_03730 [Bacillus thuringiensis serovar cameroun]
MLFSANSALLISNFSSLKLRVVLNSQINEKNLLAWGYNISESDLYNDIESVHPIIERLMSEPNFLVGEMYLDSIKNAIINFTANIEAYLKNSLSLYMKRNYSLIRKGLAEEKISIEAKDVFDFDDIKEIREKYIYIISDYKSLGELWSKKFKKYSKFIGIPKEFSSNKIHSRIDAFWKLRNDISHNNRRGLCLEVDGDKFQYSRHMEQEEYMKFIELFIRLVDDVRNFLLEVEEKALEIWNVTDGELLRSN